MSTDHNMDRIKKRTIKLYLFTMTINKLQIQTTCKIAELIEAGSMETCLLHSNDIKIHNNYEIKESNYINEFKLYYSNDIKIPLVIHGFDISFIFRLEIVLKGRVYLQLYLA